MNMMKRIGLILILSYLGGIFIIAVREDRYLYYPEKYPDQWLEPRNTGLECDDVFMQSDSGITIHGWYCPSDSNGAVILFFHGNAGHLSMRYPMIKFLKKLPAKPGVFIVDYPGYGKSGGIPKETSLFETGACAMEYLTIEKKIESKKVYLYGQSLGAAVALHTALTHPCSGLVMESAFLSVPSLADEYYWFLPGLKYFCRQKYSNETMIRKLSVPVLIVHGAADRTIPVTHGRKLFELAPEPRKSLEIPEAHHDDVYMVGGQKYRDTLDAFFSGQP
jgi:uncharacterized protein